MIINGIQNSQPAFESNKRIVVKQVKRTYNAFLKKNGVDSPRFKIVTDKRGTVVYPHGKDNKPLHATLRLSNTISEEGFLRGAGKTVKKAFQNLLDRNKGRKLDILTRGNEKQVPLPTKLDTFG